jgi:hypothetical protein
VFAGGEILVGLKQTPAPPSKFDVVATELSQASALGPLITAAFEQSFPWAQAELEAKATNANRKGTRAGMGSFIDRSSLAPSL